MKFSSKLVWGWTIGMSCLAAGLYVGKSCSNPTPVYINVKTFKKESKKCLLNNLTPIYSKSNIENIVKMIETPEEAFNLIYKLVEFPNGNEKLKSHFKFCNGEGYYSLLETLSVGGGVCRDGAIAFAALLSDNPKYEVKIVALLDNQNCGSNHAISIFKDDGKYGFASFNDDTLGKGSVFQKAKFNSIEELLGKSFEDFREYAYFKIKPEDMKFGRAIIDIDLTEKKRIVDFVAFEKFKEQYKNDLENSLKEKQALKKLIGEKNE